MRCLGISNAGGWRSVPEFVVLCLAFGLSLHLDTLFPLSVDVMFIYYNHRLGDCRIWRCSRVETDSRIPQALKLAIRTARIFDMFDRVSFAVDNAIDGYGGLCVDRLVVGAVARGGIDGLAQLFGSYI